MLRILIILSILVWTDTANAAVFKTMVPVMDTWSYTFDIKAHGPLFLTEWDCHGQINQRTGKPIFAQPSKCFNSEAEARAEAQKEADKFEKEHP